MKKGLIALLVACALAGGGYYYYRVQQNKPVPYRTSSVERGDVSETVTATGTINAVTTVQVGSQVSGTVTRLFADFNSHVRKGQIIAQIDPSKYKADLDQSRGNLANATAQVEKARIVLADAERTLKRNEQLSAAGFLAQSDVDVSMTARDSALAMLKSAEGTVAQSKGALSSSETNLKYTQIYSPVDGIVISRNVDVGQTVAASFQTPTLFTIAQDLTRMEVDVNVDEADIGKTKNGQDVTFTVDAWQGKTFNGKVSQVRYSPTVTQNVVTYNVVVLVDNRELLLRPGMTANVSVLIRTASDVLKIPNAALRYRPAEKKADTTAQAGPGRKRKDDRDGSRVYVVDDRGNPKAVRIEPGISDGAFTQLVKGDLHEKDKLITGEAKANGAKASGGPPGMGMGGFR
ncbi:MAG TPA: efflux RND transporter periplasmic adaptor subunit [Candidatus Deferrimicrobiaceae bacterium]|jgi:HlyD family secretion protein